MKRRRIAVWILLVSTLLLLASCGQSGGKETAGADTWTGYSADRQGWIALTDTAYLFYAPEWGVIKGLSPELSAPPTVMCARANCNHLDSDCSAYLPPETLYISSWNNRLYYITWGADGNSTGLYSMAPGGEDRRLERAMPELDVTSGSMSYHYTAGEGYLILSMVKVEEGVPSCQVRLYPQEDAQAEPIVIYSTDDIDTQIQYFMYVMDGWAIFSTATWVDRAAEEMECCLYGYQIDTGETVPLLEDWDSRCSLVVQDGVLYWSAINQGIFSMNLKDGTTTEYTTFAENTKGTQGYDDQYIYFSYTGENPRLVVCDYQGNQVMEFSFDSEDQLPYYYFCCEDKSFFSYSGDLKIDDYALPVCYLNKADLAKGTAEFVYLDELWN